ncbi:MAG: 2'-5' RNA ligase [Myxococcota bacterium]|jgi:2'-5' RNA ligase
MRPDNPRHGIRPSLWLLPDEASILAPVIDRLATTHSGPRFTPHLTLLGSVLGEQLVERAEALAAQLSPMTLPTGAVVGSDRWFRCLTLALPPSTALQAARAAAEAAFAVPARPWSPHISLLYGDLSEATRRRAADNLPPLPTSVRFSTLALVATIGPTEDWVERRRWRLQ